MSNGQYDNGKLGLSCPDGGHFYVCEGNATEFIGCCDSNPCGDNDGNCPTSDLRVSSFSTDRYASIPKQSCDDARGPHIWWTCQDNSPPFMGCCASNPCGEGCPQDHLIAAILSDDDSNRLPFMSPATTSAETSAVASPTSSPSGEAESGGSSGLSSGAIAGIAIGAAAAIAIVVVLIWGCVRHARKSRERSASEKPPFSPEMGSQSPPFDKTRHSHLSYATTAAPPSYGSTPSSPQGQFQDPHNPHSPAMTTQTYSPYSQYKDVDHARQGHLSVMSGVSALSGGGGIDSNLHTVSEIDGVETEAPAVELAADETPARTQASPPLPGSPGQQQQQPRAAEAPDSPGQWAR
ncbi:hypothetical protein ACHAQH_003542 [Verticillium albo-atrum]